MASIQEKIDQLPTIDDIGEFSIETDRIHAHLELKAEINYQAFYRTSTETYIADVEFSTGISKVNVHYGKVFGLRDLFHRLKRAEAGYFDSSSAFSF